MESQECLLLMSRWQSLFHVRYIKNVGLSHFVLALYSYDILRFAAYYPATKE